MSLLTCPVCGTQEETENILMCNSCHHVFRNYPELNLQKYYSEEYREEDSNKQLSLEVYDKRNGFILNQISPFISEDSSVFEVGFGYGYFHNKLTQTYPLINYQCCELSTVLADENISKGINTYKGSFVDLPKPTERYDMVSSFDVLEHFYDPKTYVSKLHQVLKKGGYAVIQVPTARAIHFEDKFDGHYHYFSKQSLTMLMGPGFENVFFYRTSPGETAGGMELLTIFRKVV